jgi:hypothetical protein
MNAGQEHILRMAAHNSASVCGECFRPLKRKEAVTMDERLTHFPAYKLLGLDFSESDKWIRVPVCRACEPWREDDRLRRMEHHRCANADCHRLMRSRYRASKTLEAQTCCWDCAETVRRQRAKARRCKHKRECVVCGETFIPRRSDAVTCGSRCRMKRYRQRQAVAQGSLSR